MASNEYTDEQLNYFRICHVAACEIPTGLRDIFKQEWDKRYAISHGNWQDTAKNGHDFLRMEKPTRRNAQALSKIRNGNTFDWDCTTLSYAIVYSNCISCRSLNPVIKTSVHNLRHFRNNFAHMADGKLSNANFQLSMQKVINAFQDLKLDTAKIEEIKAQLSFPTDELQKVHQLLEKEKKQNEEPHPFCCLPPKPSYTTIVRTVEVEEVERRMKELREKHSKEITVCYISGNPGCGKSELARQIGQRFFDVASAASTRKQVSFVNTVNASSIDSLLQSYTELAMRLKLDEDSISRIAAAKDLSPEEKVIHFRSLIVSRIQKYSSWLMIVDNVTDLKTISKYLWKDGDRTNGEGQILVTTQDSRSIPKNFHTYHRSLSSGMSETDSIKALHEISGLDSCEENTTLQVAKALDFQPLALACAAAYVHRVLDTNPSFTWQKYLQKLEEGKRKATEKVYRETSLTYPNTMTAAARIAVEKESQNEIMQFAFQFLSTLASEPVPLKYVVSYVMSCTSPEEDEDLVAAEISESSLILYSPKTQVIHVHQVIHSCLSTLNSDSVSIKPQLLQLINAFSSLLSFDPEDIDDILDSRMVVVHLNTLEKDIRDLKNKLGKTEYPNTVNILISMGEICNTHGLYKSAKTFYEFGLSFNLTSASNGSRVKSSIYNKLGNVLQQLGSYKEAKKKLEEALTMNDCTSQATTMRLLADVYIDLGDYKKSKEYAEEALIVLGKDDQNSVYLPATLNCLGKSLIYLGIFNEAKEQFEKALGIQEAVFATLGTHPAMIPTLQNLANALHEMGKYQQAKDCSERALDIQNQYFHECHPALATTLTSLANTLHYMGKYTEAHKKMQMVLDIKKKAFDKNHPIFAPTYMGLANILRDLERYKEAEAFLKKALDIQMKTFGESHPKIALTRNSMANVLIDKIYLERDNRSYHNEAVAHLQRALSIQKKVYGDIHPEIAITLNNLGNIHSSSGFGLREKAESYLVESLEIKEATYDVSHPAIAKALNNLAVLQIQRKSYLKAQLNLEKALSIQRRAYDAKHPLISVTLHNLAQALKKQGDDERAAHYCKQAEFINSRVFLPKCFDIKKSSDINDCFTDTEAGIEDSEVHGGTSGRAQKETSRGILIQEYGIMRNSSNNYQLPNLLVFYFLILCYRLVGYVLRMNNV